MDNNELVNKFNATDPKEYMKKDSGSASDLTDLLYSKRDTRKQGILFTNHMQAMTAEGLHDKADIAAELAHRDQKLQAVKSAIKSAFGEQPMACDGMLLVRAEDYDEIVRVFDV